jgi:hypothetical protein
VVILGIGLFALPTGVLASGFTEVLQRRKDEKKKLMRCPHCGRYIGEGTGASEENEREKIEAGSDQEEFIRA